jgi:hypothetical protein
MGLSILSVTISSDSREPRRDVHFAVTVWVGIEAVVEKTAKGCAVCVGTLVAVGSGTRPSTLVQARRKLMDVRVMMRNRFLVGRINLGSL